MLQDDIQVEYALDFLDDAFSVLITDTKGTILHANKHFLKTSKYESSMIVNESFEKMNVHLVGLKEEVIAKLLRGEVWKGEGVWENSAGEEQWFYLVATPVKNNEGKIHRYFIVGNDITNHKKLEVSAEETFRNLNDVKNALDEASIVAITDHRGVITYVNDKFCEISQYEEEELIGKTHRIINSKYHPKSFFKNMWDTIMQGKTWNGEVRNKAKDGSYYWMNTTIVPFFDKHKDIYQYISIRTDITARIEAETTLAEVLENDFRKIVQNLANCIFKVSRCTDNKIIFTLSEGKLAEEIELTTDVVRGKTASELLEICMAQKLEDHLHKAFNGETIKVEAAYHSYFFYMTLSPIKEEGKVTEVVGSLIDITDRKKAEDTIHFMAHYDSLTTLANQRLFNRLLDQSLSEAKLKQESLGVMFIDLDRFKNINDSLGHMTGDAVLRKVAEHLKNSLRENDVVSRLGGDEFTIFLPNVTRREAGTVAERIIKALAKPLALERLELYITPSIGISMYPDDGETVEDLLRNADSAMYLAKERGRNNYQFYTRELHRKMMDRVRLEADLRTALKKNEFKLYYQPKMNIKKNKIVGFEALIRWNHPEYGFIPPDQFIPIAEETGLIVQIGEWVLRTACKQAKRWENKGYSNLTMAVNISLRQFVQDNLHQIVDVVLRETGLKAELLELEITESMTLDADYAIGALNRMKNLGVTVSIDDFGTGYSSLSYLSKFPIDCLKIDQSFVRNLTSSNQAIIKTIIDLAHNLNMKVIAEGVEDKAHELFLLEHKCGAAQGYYYSRPLPVEETTKLLSEQF